MHQHAYYWLNLAVAIKVVIEHYAIQLLRICLLVCEGQIWLAAFCVGGVGMQKTGSK